MDGTYNRVKLLRLALLASLSPEDTNRVLKAGGEPKLYVKNRRDAICIFCLNRRLGLKKCNELLERYEEVSLE